MAKKAPAQQGKVLSEGFIKRGGVNSGSSGNKPPVTPVGQKPKSGRSSGANKK